MRVYLAYKFHKLLLAFAGDEVPHDNDVDDPTARVTADLIFRGWYA